MTAQNITEKDLPESIQPLVELIGLSEVLNLVQKCGGLEVIFSRNPKPDSILVQGVGMDIAIKLGRYYGGERVSIPKAEAMVKQLRNRAIIADADNGLTDNQLAAKYKLTTRWVREIVNRPPPADPAQLSLDFGVDL
ncbi:MAG: hypothetical protein HQL68_04565 [Magnetococcales bacterium]|nr:hypothetical protein [Magnetococcales bacterium]